MPVHKKQPRIPIIIDLEASGLSSYGYPIEVGVAFANGERYCRLIKPAKGWDDWDPDAEQVHGINREMLLSHGVDVTQVANELNDMLAGKTVYTDGWVVDKPWLTKLFFAAGIDQQFSISDLQMILSEAQMSLWHDVQNSLRDTLQLKRHRASDDAKIIQQTYQETLRLTQAETQSQATTDSASD